MTLPNTEKITLLIIFVLIASIVPFCMVISSRNSLIQERVHELVVTQQESNLSIEQCFRLPTDNDANKKKVKYIK